MSGNALPNKTGEEKQKEYGQGGGSTFVITGLKSKGLVCGGKGNYIVQGAKPGESLKRPENMPQSTSNRPGDRYEIIQPELENTAIVGQEDAVIDMRATNPATESQQNGDSMRGNDASAQTLQNDEIDLT